MKFFKATLFIFYALAVMTLPPPICVPIGKQKTLEVNTNPSVAKCFKVALLDNIKYCNDPVCTNFNVPANIVYTCTEEPHLKYIKYLIYFCIFLYLIFIFI